MVYHQDIPVVLEYDEHLAQAKYAALLRVKKRFTIKPV
jgi:hypothetical protein